MYIVHAIATLLSWVLLVSGLIWFGLVIYGILSSILEAKSIDELDAPQHDKTVFVIGLGLMFFVSAAVLKYLAS
jgi:hypothetical protein